MDTNDSKEIKINQEAMCNALFDCMRNTVKQQNPDVDVDQIPFNMFVEIIALKTASMIAFIQQQQGIDISGDVQEMVEGFKSQFENVTFVMNEGETPQADQSAPQTQPIGDHFDALVLPEGMKIH